MGGCMETPNAASAAVIIPVFESDRLTWPNFPSKVHKRSRAAPDGRDCSWSPIFSAFERLSIVRSIDFKSPVNPQSHALRQVPLPLVEAPKVKDAKLHRTCHMHDVHTPRSEISAVAPAQSMCPIHHTKIIQIRRDPPTVIQDRREPFLRTINNRLNPRLTIHCQLQCIPGL